MPKKKGLGRDVEKCLQIMDDLESALKKFYEMPLKRGLQSNKALDDDINKLINTSREKATALMNDIDDIEKAIKSVKTDGNSRFASQRVVEKFLDNTF
jgi:hypothetical protein